MKTKKIMNRRTGEFLTADEALTLCARVQRQTGAVYVESVSSYGYPTPEMSEKATLSKILEAYEGYSFAFIGTVNRTFEGYKVRVIGIKDLPAEFEQLFPDYVVIG